MVTDALRNLSIPGAVVLVRTPRGQYAEAFGTRQVGTSDPIAVGDHFRIGSITKTMVGTVVLQLVQEHRIGLSDPVAKYRPDVPGGELITVADLLDMRSGLYNYTELPSFLQEIEANPKRIWQPEELLGLGLGQPPYFAPGQGFHYSNTNAVLLGLIVEQVTGRRLSDVLRQRIFAPLGLRDTLLPGPDEDGLPDPHPRAYQFGGLAADPVLPPDEQAAAHNGTLLLVDVTGVNPSMAWAAGAVISTAGDLADFAEALVGGGLLNDELQHERLSSVAPAGRDDPAYGLALARAGTFFGHDGEIAGFQSFLGHDPDRHITVVVLTNLANAPDGRPTADSIAESIAARL